ncbi:hypothetical protein AXF42_Ash005921 [Apostasia shenzhenica]|uniref:SprT-like domain-containing protein n=1 Tax=Apostasia shenzhenica TaxID=1088818 RepID=A0A2I0AZR6_9ASPA|nr:hypothetical protein AXF42_Ash005921 [Apostasia shenzhenica]
MGEPRPDLHELFEHYNALYFCDALGTCTVAWAPRMTCSIGSCHYIKDGLCEIRLSEPRLKSCSSALVKNSLLHEMIHAFLWVKDKNKKHSDHGPKFWAMANKINSNCVEDNQRPSDGYNITANHGFHDKAGGFDLWMCESCGDLIKREISGESLICDCIEKIGNGSDCGNLLCGWHKHNKLCSGKYKMVDLSGFEDKGKGVEDAQENSGTIKQKRRKPHPTEKAKDGKEIKRPKKAKCLSEKPFQGDFSNNSKQLLLMDLKAPPLPIGPSIPKQQRTHLKKKCDNGNTEKKKKKQSDKREREMTLAVRWLGVYTDEESEEDPQPLTNKRSLKRRKLLERLQAKGKQEGLENEDVEKLKERGQTCLTDHEVIVLD